jgi:hypothetical protein
MKHRGQIILIVLLILATACGKSHTHEQGHEHVTGDSTNTALNEKVMGIHDEVMPKMQDLYNLKIKLQDTLAHSKSMAAEKKAEIQALILALDSTSTAMMDWMHHFNPEVSKDQEKTREYLETQIEAINRIKEQTAEVIERGRAF